MTSSRFIPLPGYREYSVEEMQRRAAEFYAEVRGRRTVRQFSDRAVPPEVIQDCLRAAGTAPSGANLQNWHFVVVTDPKIKRQIREAAEKEEHEFYTHRATPEWLAALEPLGTDQHKPFLERAPVIIAVFAKLYEKLPDGRTTKTYYPLESVGLATGILITALHHAGLASLTHTPSPMRFLNSILKRPDYEKPFLLLVVGYPEPGATVPDIGRKSLDEFTSFV
jgi:iodotyrosine deiodinase